MESDEFNEWIEQLAKLSTTQRKKAGRALQNFCEKNAAEIPPVLTDTKAECCPDCESQKIIKWGRSGGLQRWRCKECKRSFNILTGTPLARLRKRDKWLDNAQAMIDSLTLEKTAERCDVHINTAFRWRHRFAKMLGKAQCNELSGITESDVTLFYKSEKGSRSLEREARRRGGDKIPKGYGPHLVSVITLIDRFRHGADRIALDSVREHALELFSSHLDPDATLLTDGGLDLRAAIKDINQKINEAADERDPQKHQALIGSKNSRGKIGNPLHIQTVNSQHSHLKRWIERFYGVATKYLENYVGWHRHLYENHYQSDPNLFIGLAFRPQSISKQLVVIKK